VSGAPSLDNLKSLQLATARELEQRHGLTLTQPPVLVTYHPVTLEYEDTPRQIGELLAALQDVDLPIVFTMPNADTHGRIIADAIRAFVRAHPAARLVDNFGTRDFLSMMALAAVMVGNSSSQLIEAPSFKLPAVNVGNRQRGRVRAANVIDVGYGRDEISGGMRRALDPAFRAGLKSLANPYGTGNAAAAIVDRLKTVALADARLLSKTFHDIAH
jgi:UDP-hydrolysing UDP-N-acetyl-D-glucosamine 2-epimerase